MLTRCDAGGDTKQAVVAKVQKEAQRIGNVAIKDEQPI